MRIRAHGRTIFDCFFCGLLAGAFMLAGSAAQAAPNVVRFATVAPEGTAWLKALETFAADVKQGTSGEVEIKIYSSSKMGDEPDVLRKMRSGQLHGGAFSGMGLGQVQPAVRVLELPYLFKSKEEIDFVTERLFETLSRRFAEKGMVLVGTSEAGNVFMFTKTPIHKRQDLQNVKMWVWEGDPLAQAFFKVANIVPVPLPITDVITALQTGMVTGVYSPPMGMIGFQWWPKVSYMVKPELLTAIGGILITDQKWKSMTVAQQKVVRASAKKAGEELTRISRADNETAIASLQKNNIQLIDLDPAARADLEGLGKDLQKELTGKLYDEALLRQVQGLIQEFRTRKSG